jgi:putative transposase
MTAKTLAALLLDLGVAQSHSRPMISDDNPYAESQFKTMKYGPTYPERFASIAAARTWMRWFADWYNHDHKHRGIALLPPAVVHSGRAAEAIAKRQTVLDQAYTAHPERFVRGRPQAPQLPAAVGINLPRSHSTDPTTATTTPLPADTSPSRVSAAQRPLDGEVSAGQAAAEVLALELSHAPHFT